MARLALFRTRMVRSNSEVQVRWALGAYGALKTLAPRAVGLPALAALMRPAEPALGFGKYPICSGNAAEIQMRFLRPGSVARLLAMNSMAWSVEVMRLLRKYSRS